MRLYAIWPATLVGTSGVSTEAGIAIVWAFCVWWIVTDRDA